MVIIEGVLVFWYQINLLQIHVKMTGREESFRRSLLERRRSTYNLFISESRKLMDRRGFASVLVSDCLALIFAL